MRESIPSSLLTVYKKLENHVLHSKRFKLGITCHPKYIVTAPDYIFSEPLYTSKNKEFIEELAKNLIDYSKNLLTDKCVNIENLKVNDLSEEIRGEFTIYVVYA